MFLPRLVGAAETPKTTTLAGKKIFSILLSFANSNQMMNVIGN
jgi:hypothetical protein